jgi:hypothetical protein
MWQQVNFLELSIPVFKGLKASITKDDGWAQWQQCSKPHVEAFPAGMCPLMTGTHILKLIVRSFKGYISKINTNMEHNMPTLQSHGSPALALHKDIHQQVLTPDIHLIDANVMPLAD